MIEVARDREGDNAKKATVSRRERLLGLYKACRDEYPELYKAIEAADEGDCGGTLCIFTIRSSANVCIRARR